MTLPSHLANSARDWERALRELYPEYQWVVTGREDAAECAGSSAAAGRDESTGVAADANAALDEDDTAGRPSD